MSSSLLKKTGKCKSICCCPDKWGIIWVRSYWEHNRP